MKMKTNRKTKGRFPIQTIIVAGGDEVRILAPPAAKIQYGVTTYGEVESRGPPYSVYVIRSDSEGWWNNDDGWVENRSQATVFDDEQHLTFSLPLSIPDVKDVKWMRFSRTLTGGTTSLPDWKPQVVGNTVFMGGSKQCPECGLWVTEDMAKHRRWHSEGER